MLGLEQLPERQKLGPVEPGDSAQVGRLVAILGPALGVDREASDRHAGNRSLDHQPERDRVGGGAEQGQDEDQATRDNSGQSS